MQLSQDILDEDRVKDTIHYVLLLKKFLYGVKQAGILWSKLLHSKLVELGFRQFTTNICLYVKNIDITIVVVYFDDLLIIGTSHGFFKRFF